MIKDFFRDKVTISIISLALAFSFFASFVSSVFSPLIVSAAVDVSSFPDLEFANGVDRSSYESVIESLHQNESISDLGDCYILLNVGNRCEFYIFKDFTQVRTAFDGYYGINVQCYVPSKYGKFENIEKASVSSYNFVLSDFNYNDSRVLGVLPSTATSFPYMPLGLNQSDQIYDHNPNVYCFYSSVTPPFVPDFSGPLVGFPVGLEFSVADFMQWLVDNDKIAVSADSGGVSVGGKIPAYIGMSKLQSFLEFYKQFGGSNTSFVTRIWSWFSYMNIGNQTNDNIVILKNTIDSLYREYINSYKHEFYSNSANQAHHRRNVNTQTTDDDLTLVTDDANDDIYTTLLREIIRGIVALQSSIVSGLRAVIDTLNNLDFTVNVANNGGTGFDANSIWGTGDITQSENYLALTAAFMDKGVDVSAAENMQINYLENATQRDSFTVSVVMPDQFVNGQFTEKTVTHTIDNTSKMYNTLILFRKLIAFAVVAYFAIRIRFELPHLIRGE